MNSRVFLWLFGAISLVYLPGLNVEVMGVDSSQYAVISREMTETGEFLEVKTYGRDYLDKPPLLFWVNSLFFSIFGYHNWSFKLGSFLFTLFGVFSTYKLGSLLYSARTGRLAAILLYSCQAMFLMNNDVRTDTILAGSTVFAIWQLLAWVRHKSWLNLIGAAVGLALAMLTKGPVGLMVPAIAIGSYLIGKGRWRDFFHWQYIPLLLMVLLFISPMLWGLYQQYDAHPEKEVLMITPEGLKPETGVSGLEFYFWTQSFGRLTGENVWSNNAGPFFFVGNFIWSFLPWSLTFILALVWQFRRAVVNWRKTTALPELLTLGGFILPFIAFSLSNYKLPHYIFILYPLAAILTAHWWQSIYELPGAKYWRIASYTAQQITLLSITVVMILVLFRFFPGDNWALIIACLILIVTASYLVSQGTDNFMPVVLASVMVILAGNLVMNTWFYPRLMQYQPGQSLVNVIDQYEIPHEEVHTFGYWSFSFDYYMGNYANNSIQTSVIEEELGNGNEVVLVTNEKGKNVLDRNFTSEVLYEMPTHSVTLLNLKFLNQRTRPETLEPVYLMKIIATKG